MTRLVRQLLLVATIVIVLAILTSCSSEKSTQIRVTLNQSQRLSETNAGWWLKELGISRTQDADPTSHYRNALVYRVRKALEAQGQLHDQYIEGKDTLVKEYIIPIKRPLYGLHELLIREKQTGGENAFLWFEIPLPPKGIPWLLLLSSLLANNQISGSQYDQFIETKMRGHLNAVVIESPKEQGERLLLYGWGANCTEIVLD